MRVFYLLGVLCVVFAVAYGQDVEASGAEDAAEETAEATTLTSGVVYTPHNMTNVFIVTRSVGEDPGPQEDGDDDEDENNDYGREVHSPSDHIYGNFGGSFDELRSKLNKKSSEDNGDEDENNDYGRVVHSPRDHIYGNFGGSFDELRSKLNKKSSENNGDEDENNDYGRVVHSPSDRIYGNFGGSFDELRSKLNKKSSEENDDGAEVDNPWGKVLSFPSGQPELGSSSLEELQKKFSNVPAAQLDTLKKALVEGHFFDLPEGSGHGDSSTNPGDPKKLQFLSENVKHLFNKILESAAAPGHNSNPYKTNSASTGMMDSVLAVGYEMNKMYAEMYAIANMTCAHSGF